MNKEVLVLLCWFVGTISSLEKRDDSAFQFIRSAIEFDKRVSPAIGVSAFLCSSQASAVKLVRSLSDDGVMVSAHTDCNHWPDLPLIHEEYKFYLVDLQCDCSVSLLNQANEMKLFNLKTHWLLLDDPNYDTTSIRSTLDGTSSRNTREVDSVLDDNPKSSDTCSDIPTNNKEEDDDEGVEPCYDQFFDNSTINGRHTRSTESDDDLGYDLVSIFESLDVHVGSQVVVGRRLSEKRFHLIEVYKNGPADKIKTGVVGVWEGQSRVRVTADYVTSRRRGGVDRKTLRAAVVITTNYTIGHLLDIENKHIDAVVRLNYNLLIPAMEMVNASLEVLHEPTWGYNYNGSWNGIVGRLQRGEADIAGTSMFLLSERLGVIDFTVMTLPTKVGFLFRQPPLSSVRNIFTLPFDGHVWACCVALITLCGIVLYYTLRWERREDRASQKASKEDSSIKEGLVESTTIDSDRTVSWSDVVLLSLGAVCQQGSPIESHGPSGRIASLLLFVVVIFLYTSYSASIVVLLQSTTGSIRTLKDLLESPLGMGVEDIVYTRYLFKNQSEPVHKAIYNKKIAPPGTKPRFMDIGKGMEMMRKGFFAFHIEASSGYKIILETFEESEKCGITLLPYIGNTDNYLSVRKGSPYRELVTVAYRKLQERGFQQRALNRYYTNKPECTARDSSFVSVGLIDFYPAILVLVYGLMCAAGTLILELLVNKRLKVRRNNITAFEFTNKRVENTRLPSKTVHFQLLE